MKFYISALVGVIIKGIALLGINWNGEASVYAKNLDIWIFFYVLHWHSLKLKNVFTNGYFRLHTYLLTNKTLIYNYVYVYYMYLTNGGGM